MIIINNKFLINISFSFYWMMINTAADAYDCTLAGCNMGNGHSNPCPQKLRLIPKYM